MTKILYPRGNGGQWLGNLIWHLEHEDFSLPEVDVVFDGEICGSVPLSHVFEIMDQHRPDQITYLKRTANDLLFSHRYLFNHYLNVATKVEYHICRLGQQPWLTQFFKLSNTARYCLADQHYRDQYCDRIDLDYALIFTDPDKFCQTLFAVLNKLQVQYAANSQYVLHSMEYYRSTCVNPRDHFDRFDSVLWLGACHAIALIDNLQIEEPIQDSESAQRLLLPYTDYCKQRLWPHMLEWKL